MAEITLPLVVTVEEPPAYETGTVGVPLRVSVVPAELIAGESSVCVSDTSAAVWTAVVTVGGIDRSSILVGDVTVEAEEGAARIAEFTLRPPAGTTFTPADWMGADVTIDVADYSTGTPRYAMRLFTGVVDQPSIDLTNRLIALRCTDDLQGRCDAVSNATLLALIGGYDSPAVFDAAAIGWSYAQDRLSTVPAALDISPLGELRVTPWAPKETPDIVLGAGLLGDNSLGVSFAERSALVNQVTVEFDYRFPRVKAECYSIVWSYVNMTNFAQFILDGGWFLQRAQVEAAISSAGGTIESVTWTPLPDEIIAVGSGYFTPSANDVLLCMGFDMAVSFDYTQTIEEQHRIAVRAIKSIEAIGLRRETVTGALEGEYPDVVAVETGIRLYKESITSIPPANTATANAGQTTSADVTLTSETDRAAAEAAMRALIAVAKTRIYGSHRGHRVTATVPLIPALDLDKTLRLDGAGVTAQGKCARVVHRLSPDTGEATSDVAVALCSIAGIGIVHDEDATAASDGTEAGTTSLGGVPEVVYNSGAEDDHTITITFPAVDADERSLAEVEIPSAIAAPLIEDELTLTL